MFDTSTFISIQNNAKLPAWNVLLEPSGFLELILPWFFGLAGIILIFNLISAGFKLMTSQGDPKAISASQAKITTSLIGILIIFISFWTVRLILQFFGIDIQLIG